ncbi:hypothetical protein Gohar_027317, partial [Gossypium harknessii]|nr:hypothetical protein [Gossypium harknessii]
MGKMEEDLANLNIFLRKKKLHPKGKCGALYFDEEYACRSMTSIGRSYYFRYWGKEIHNLPIRLMSKGMARQFGNFIGTFMEHHTALISRETGRFMRIRVKEALSRGLLLFDAGNIWNTG